MSYNPFSLEGKTILVTGASSGIGRQSAIECSKMGAQLIIVGRNEERLKMTLDSLEQNNNHKYIVADLCNADDLNLLVDSIDCVEGMVLSAGILYTTPVKFASRDKFTNVFDTNFFSTVELSRRLYKEKKIKEGGSIVIIDSVGGVFGFPKGNVIYGTSKAALNSYMKYASKEFAIRKIRVNCICPGMIETPLIHNGALSEEDLKKDLKEKYPLQRYGKPEDIAYGAIYLLSDSSSWVTGHDLVIDGGCTAR